MSASTPITWSTDRKTLLIRLFFLVLLSAHISKWGLTIGFRINYYVPFVCLWSICVLAYIGSTSLAVPRPFKVLMLLKVGFLFAVLITAPLVLMQSRAELVPAFLKGLVTECLNTLGIVVFLMFATQLKPAERQRVLDVYLLALSVCALYTLLQAFGGYVAGFDIDQEISSRLPMAAEDASSIEEDRWGFSGRRFYRLTGLTGDPNLNAVTFVVAIPLMFLRSRGRFSVPVATLLIVSIAIIIQSVSLSAMLGGVLLLVALSARYFKSSRWITTLTVAGVLGVSMYLWMYEPELVNEITSTKLDRGATTASHLEIAIDALLLWREHLMGVGLNGFAVYSPHFSAHNTYLQVLAELGLLGLVMTLATVGYYLRICVRSKGDLGFAAAIAIGALSLMALGHDLLNRFEFQLVMCMLAAFAVQEQRERVVSQGAVARIGSGRRPVTWRVPDRDDGHFGDDMRAIR